MSGYKRKGTYQSGPSPNKKRRRSAPRVVPGITRKSGFYGKYPKGGGEMKFLDTNIDDAIIAQNGTIQNAGTVNVIAQGTGESQRVGRKVTIKQLHWRYTITRPENLSAADLSSGDIVRVIVYEDKQCNGTAATVTDILEDNDYQSFRNLANSGRFSIIYDKTHDMNLLNGISEAGNSVSTSAVFRSTQFHKTCHMPIEYNGTDGTIAEIRSNNLGVLLLSRDGAKTSFSSVMRLRYFD